MSKTLLLRKESNVHFGPIGVVPPDSRRNVPCSAEALGSCRDPTMNTVPSVSHMFPVSRSSIPRPLESTPGWSVSDLGVILQNFLLFFGDLRRFVFPPHHPHHHVSLGLPVKLSWYDWRLTSCLTYPGLTYILTVHPPMTSSGTVSVHPSLLPPLSLFSSLFS